MWVLRKMRSIIFPELRLKGALFGTVSAAGDAQRGVPGELRGVHPALAGGFFDGFPFVIGEADRTGAARFAAFFVVFRDRIRRVGGRIVHSQRLQRVGIEDSSGRRER